MTGGRLFFFSVATLALMAVNAALAAAIGKVELSRDQWGALIIVGVVNVGGIVWLWEQANKGDSNGKR